MNTPIPIPAWAFVALLLILIASQYLMERSAKNMRALFDLYVERMKSFDALIEAMRAETAPATPPSETPETGAC